jgi:hypothetical protein
MARVKEGRPLRKSVTALIVVGTLVGFLAVFAVWANRQALETDTWVETSGELLEDEEIQDAVAGFLVDTLFANVDVEAELQGALPPQAQALAGPVAGGLHELAGRAAKEALARPRVQLVWEEANRAAHETFLDVVENDANVDVSLDLGTIVEDLGQRVGIDVASKLPPDAGQIQILKADQLSAAQSGVDILRKLGFALAFAALAIYGLAIYLARGWRREALRNCGFGFILIGVLVLAVRSFAGDLLVDSLAAVAASEPAVSATWSIGTGLLEGGGWAMVGYGVAIVLGAWLAGPGALAQSARRTITPVVRERPIGYAVLFAIVLLVFLWSPTEGTSRLIPSLVLIVLMVAGFEALRGQAIRDFPDETMDRAQERWRQRLQRRGA